MFRSKRTLILPIAIVAILSLPGVVDAQGKKPAFDVGKFLTRLDTNKNGKVEPDEIKDDRTRSFLEKSGVNTSKPISIKGYSKQIKKKRKERNNPRSSQQSLGFAVDDDERDEEFGSSLGFTVSDEERAPVAKTSARKFSEKTQQTLDWVLKNYDKNKDGKIDKSEIKSARWTDPPVEDSDTNKDGSLSRMELLVRYQKREDAKANRDKDRSSSRSSWSRDRSSRDRDRGRDRERARDRDSSKSSSSSKSKSEATSENKTGNRDVRKGYESYVAGLFKSYDKNKDGFLDSEETKTMRRPPDKKADADGDKKISKDELLDSYLEKAGQGRKSSRTSSGSSSGKGTSSSRSSKSSSDDGKKRSPLTSKDKNKNGQIEMAEFVSDWTVDMIEEFNSIDKNRDGVITKAEWESKKK